MHLTFTITDTATPAVARLRELVSGPSAKMAAGRGMRNVTTKWLRDLDGNRPFKHPGASTHFFQQAADSTTQPEVDGDGVSISITQVGMRQRLLGGDISPQNAKFLTVAANAAAYGHRAGEFEGLKFAFAQDENGDLHPALVTTEAFQERGSVRNRRGDGPKPPFGPDTVMFWLYRHVHQEPDESVIPGEDYLRDGAVRGLRSFVRSRLHDPGADVRIVEEGSMSADFDIKALADSVTDALLADPFFSGLPSTSGSPIVISDDPQVILTSINEKLNEIGLGLIVLNPSAHVGETNMPGPYFDKIHVVVKIFENPTINRAATNNGGNNPTCYDAAINVCRILHFFQPNGIDECLLVTDMTPVADEDLLIYQVVLTTKAGLSRPVSNHRARIETSA